MHTLITILAAFILCLLSYVGLHMAAYSSTAANDDGNASVIAIFGVLALLWAAWFWFGAFNPWG